MESAAIEAGISQRYVALALSELPGTDALESAVDPSEAREQAGRAILGRVQRSLSVSRVIRAPARDVLKAMGRTFQNATFRLTLKDQLGRHPLDGGILVFKLPDMDASGTNFTHFTWLRYGLYARELRATIRPLDLDGGAAEVTVVADLRPGVGYNVWGYGIIAGGISAVSGVIGGAIGAKAMALAGLAIGAPAAITALAAGALAISASRAFYRWELQTATQELEELLQAIEGTLRTRSVFEEDPPALPPPPAASGPDITLLST